MKKFLYGLIILTTEHDIIRHLNMNFLWIFIILAGLTTGYIVHFQKAALPHKAKLINGAEETFLYVDKNDIIHQMKFSGTDFQELHYFEPGFEVRGCQIKNKEAEQHGNGYYHALGANDLLLINITDSAHSSIQLHSTEELKMVDSGSNPKNAFYVTTNPSHYVFNVKDLIANLNTTKFQILSSFSPSTFIVINGWSIVGLQNGSLYYQKDDALLSFGHSGEVSKIYYNLSTSYLISGDADGEVLVAYGNRDIGYSFNFSYYEHSCKIVSIVVFGDWIITSDECGFIVQYDIKQ